MSAVIDLKPRINLANEEKVARYQELERQIAKRQEELKALKKALIAELDDNNELRNRNGEKIAWLQIVKANTFNTDEFKKDFGDIYDEYKTKIVTRKNFKTA